MSSTLLHTFKHNCKLMGNRFEFSVVDEHQNETNAQQKIQLAVNEIQRIENKLSTFKPNSETNLINNHAGIKPVQVSTETLQLIERCLKISELTQGAFDISYGSLNKSFWNFDTTMKALPSKELALQAVALINYKNIEIDTKNSTVFLKQQGMRIGFGGIGKGYAADKAKQLLQKQGVQHGIVNASGDLCAWGHQPNGKEWTVGIANPQAAHLPFAYMQINQMAVATSGNYEKFVVIDGKKIFAHH